MDLHGFLESLGRLDGPGIARAAAEIEARSASAAGELSWWKATVEIDRQLRLHRAARMGALAATQASSVVIGAAVRAGLTMPDDRVTLVARAAADVARGLVAESSAARDLLDGCTTLAAA